MRDVFGYIAYGENELYHRGALLSALKLLYHCPEAKIIVATDRPELFVDYPMETLLLTDMQKEAWSFSGQYHFGIKARALIKLLRMTDRLIFMDSDHYPAGFLSLGFESISPKHSVMRRLEKPHKWTPVLEGEGLRIGEHVITGREPMWQSGILGVHRDNLPALMDAYPPMLAVHQISKIDAAEQFCIGIALSLGGGRSARISSRSGTIIREGRRRSQNLVYIASSMHTLPSPLHGKSSKLADIECGGRR
ncbi:hypothetical protein X735_01305 [Mesorhizobium sp. L2C085B000]|uniref:hypothetical protein n=1 Tax=Mesorhizobium sp. L2C085B000 TaxID=1287117 RepID=UPI0003D062F2|nr:hypothetical protein [Mesorhizobium sp. L2C085B000]ESZ17535.1 hypothetical protein X735_01305 [Mesorhizobium sp. L2C085B000]